MPRRSQSVRRERGRQGGGEGQADAGGDLEQPEAPRGELGFGQAAGDGNGVAQGEHQPVVAMCRTRRTSFAIAPISAGSQWNVARSYALGTEPRAFNLLRYGDRRPRSQTEPQVDKRPLNRAVRVTTKKDRRRECAHLSPRQFIDSHSSDVLAQRSPDFSVWTTPLITQQSSVRALPRVRVVACNSILEKRPSARSDSDSSALLFGTENSQRLHPPTRMAPAPNDLRNA